MVEVGTEVGNMVEVEVEEGTRWRGQGGGGMGAEEEVAAHGIRQMLKCPLPLPSSVTVGGGGLGGGGLGVEAEGWGAVGEAEGVEAVVVPNVVNTDDGDADKAAERAVAVEVAVLGKYTSEATAMLPEVMLVMEVSAVVTPAAAANWVRKEALNEAEKLAASKAVMSRPAKYTVEVTTSTISCPGGGVVGLAVVGYEVVGFAVVGCTVVGCAVAGCTVVGCTVVGCTVVGCTEVGCMEVGCAVVG
ncbi:hypothetical protein CYMTET_14935 [Cymbomonas tetramitiformis]|uniref:Uncharacterized protein n=1 Tax=Cymbomonas tetramitiformis TaxID=36881 RepID=A0AAE0GFD4_9CHLO|nr:hypothetical protein CYMTET_14935 [Cymbomonas tetramitiformis]